MKANIFTETAVNIWANVKYYFEGLRLAKYGPMYKDEAEAGREIIDRLQAENRLLREQYARQSELVRTLAAGK